MRTSGCIYTDTYIYMLYLYASALISHVFNNPNQVTYLYTLQDSFAAAIHGIGNLSLQDRQPSRHKTSYSIQVKLHDHFMACSILLAYDSLLLPSLSMT